MKSIVLLSGGIDSAVAAALEREKGYEVFALSVDYGQSHRCEIQAAEKIAKWLGAIEHRIVQFDLGQLAKGPLVGEPTLCRTLEEIRETPSPAYVPARNTILISLALAWGEVVGSRLDTRIVIAPNLDDAIAFPDCSRPWVEAAQRVAQTTLIAPSINAPLLSWRKPRVIQAAHDLGIPLKDTLSCYQPVEWRDGGFGHCGRCDACVLRKDGFSESGVEDPTVYADVVRAEENRMGIHGRGPQEWQHTLDLKEKEEKMGHMDGGLEERYIIVRRDGKPMKPDSRYIVLNYATDPHAKAALQAYVESVRKDNPELARGIKLALDDPNHGIAQHPNAVVA